MKTLIISAMLLFSTAAISDTYWYHTFSLGCLNFKSGFLSSGYGIAESKTKDYPVIEVIRQIRKESECYKVVINNWKEITKEQFEQLKEELK